jgi:mono/diheme cytochrome c family protein
MKRLLVVLCTLPILSLNAAACSDSETTDPGGDRKSAILALTGDATAGQAIFEDTCGLEGPCHMDDGTPGASSDAPDLTTELSGFSDDQVLDAVLNGKGDMTKQDFLSDQEIANALAYIRSEWGGG